LPPRALILAAGRGRRLGNESAPEAHEPKVLLSFAGRTLLERHVNILRRCGVEDITLVLGYKAGLVETELARIGGAGLSFEYNPDFREGSVVSLRAGARVMRDDAPVLLMDGDVLYDVRLMTRLLQSNENNALLLDREVEPGDEPVKLCVSEGRIVDFHKRPQHSYEWHGESVGFFRFTPAAAAELADRVDDYVSGNRRGMEYEEPLRDMILASETGRFGFEDITGLPWTEIDFPEDVTKANGLLPELVP
jgi:choline kinase